MKIVTISKEKSSKDIKIFGWNCHLAKVALCIAAITLVGYLGCLGSFLAIKSQKRQYYVYVFGKVRNVMQSETSAFCM